MKIAINQEYRYSDIENFANENDFNITELGNNVGSNFLVLAHNEKDITLSFVLVGATSKNYVYKLIYTDFQNQNITLM
jgi:hypothetical protein|tara:strand:- start:1237 stop:1470 length:234 start_codon:yes stop_codon:yes gene_type:complete